MDIDEKRKLYLLAMDYKHRSEDARQKLLESVGTGDEPVWELKAETARNIYTGIIKAMEVLNIDATMLRGVTVW